MIIIQVKIISGHQVKRSTPPPNWDLELRYIFLGQIFAKHGKSDSETLFETSKSVHNKIRKMAFKSRNDMKTACFLHVFCHNSAIFENIDLTFCTHIHEPLSYNMLYGFMKNCDFER